MKETVKSWIKKAEEDYSSAVYLLDAIDPLLGVVIFQTS